MTSLLSEKGPSVTVIFPFASRTRRPSLLGSRPPVSTRVPSLSDLSTNLPIASINAGGGGVWRYDSEWRMNVRYFMVPPVGSEHATNELGADRHAPLLFLRRPTLTEYLASRDCDCFLTKLHVGRYTCCTKGFMLLTITSTSAPATDLGYLLHKSPFRAQAFDLTFGKAH